MDPQLLQEAQRRHKVKQARYLRHDYARFTDEVRKVPRGTALFDEAEIWGYPQIGRIMSLESGLQEHFHGAFHIEEKVDGYNVRIFRHKEEVLALSRGGYVCPFTTDRIHDLMDTRFFDDHPELVVCAEIAGPGNPYLPGSPPFIDEDVQAFVFDVMYAGRPGFLGQDDKRELTERYGLPAVTHFGRFEHRHMGAIRELLARLNDEGREGLVFKQDGPAGHRAKYITGNAGIADIRLSMPGLNEMPAEFFTNRILLLAFFLTEAGITPSRDDCEKLGRALLEGLFEAIEQYRDTRRVYHRHRCRFRDKANAECLLAMFSRRTKEMQIIPRGLEREGDYYVLEFDKVYPGMTGLIAHLLGGGLVFD